MNFHSADIELICVNLKSKLVDQNFQLHSKLEHQALVSLILTMRQILPSQFSDYKFDNVDEKSAYDGLIGCHQAKYKQSILSEQFESNSQRVSIEQDQWLAIKEQLTEENQSLRKELEVKQQMLQMKFSGDIIKQVEDYLKLDKQKEYNEYNAQLQRYEEIQCHNDNIDNLKLNNIMLANQVQEYKIQVETLNLELQNKVVQIPQNVQQSIPVQNSNIEKQIHQHVEQQINKVEEQYEVEQVDLIGFVLFISGVLLIALYYQQ